ncbi:polysaccharide deacetylase family protein [Reyranella sp.]|uniref:polysaccharide deacetylase family protein n=1 Tax=Reyranella sp. TaxID=1929291 RepID=UPI002724944C|nr:polysaccharide deacetylase family protein [Reyranella sp.]MDO8975062.1 polysaccharide deacetylase family protein [Reyranella sp.]
MSSWQALADEAARWRDEGRIAELWWRDDDATDAGPALDRLLAIVRDRETPLAMAVVPARATAALADRLAGEPGVDVLQHGYAHTSHSVAPEKSIELGLQRPAMLTLGELGTGWMALERLFGSRALAVMVPPWNRIAPVLVPTLPEIGYRGLSTFGPRPRLHPVRGLLQVNTHVDLIDWKGGRTFAGEETVLAALVTALARARGGDGEPIGILSHHLAMDAGAWDFLRSLWERMTKLENIRVRSARELFAPEAGRRGGRG